MVLQACLNGDRETGVPRTPDELAAAARACVAAGATSLHAHPRDARRRTSRSTRAHIAAAVRALRAASRASRSRFSTGLWITGGDVDARARGDPRAGPSGPDLVSLNLVRGGLARAGAAC